MSGVRFPPGVLHVISKAGSEKPAEIVLRGIRENMDNNGKRPVKKPENPVREWISDNLRYLILIGVIIIVAVAIFFVARAIMQEGSKQTNASSVSQQNTTESTTDITSKSTSADTSSVSIKSESTAATQTPTAEPTQEASLTEASGDVSNVITTYFNALSSKDASAAASVLETLSDEDSAAISAGQYASNYTDISVYSYPGDVDGSYFVLAKYNYTYPEYTTLVPALTQFYVFTRDDGSLCIASEETQQSKAALFDEILQRDDVSALVNEVKTQYDAALASDPALAEYINGISA